MREDLKFSALVAAIVAVPLFFAFAALWNPHGSIGSLALHFVGLFGIAPFLYVAEFLGYRLGLVGVLFACIAQYIWVLLWVLLLRRLLKALRGGRSAL